MSQRTLTWPRRIARIQRQPLTTGHGSFLLHRVHLGDDAFDCQRVQLGGYLLVLAREGSVILDGDKTPLLLQEGDAAIVPPGRFKITEIPRPGFSRGETLYWFFNQRTLADLVAARDGLDETAARIALPALPFYPARGLATALDAALATKTPKTETDLRRVFASFLNVSPAMTGTFLKHEYFIPRFKLCFFLEGQCMGKIDLRRIAALYPDGATAFRRDCANYLGLPVERWLFRRRIELARHWLRYTDRSENEVAAQLGYRDRRRFRGDMKRFGRFSPLELKTLRLFGPKEADRQASLPSWFPDREARAARCRENACEVITIAMQAPTQRIQRALLRKYSDEARSTWNPSDVFHATPTPVAEDAPDAHQETLPDNIISWDQVEKWRAGESSLGIDRPLSALAA